MRINFVYNSPKSVSAGYMGSSGLVRALKANHLLNYANDSCGDEFLDIDKLRSAPIFYVRGFLKGRFPYVIKAGNQFKATWQSESYYTRTGEEDSSTKLCVDNQKHFNMIFTCADDDLDKYEIPTYWLPSWADTTVLDDVCRPEYDGLGFIGGPKGREDFLDKDPGILNCKRAGVKRATFEQATEDYTREICKFRFLVSPPGRCFTGMCGRAWEIMACKRLCFQYLNEDTMYKTMEFFKDGRDIVYFHDWAELIDKYNYYKNHLAEADEIANNGYNCVRSFHNQNVRAKYIVKCMEVEYMKWKKEQDLLPEWVKDIKVGV